MSRRRDEFDDRRFDDRRDRDDDHDREPPRRSNTVGTLSLVCGVLSLVGALVPCIGLAAAVSAAFGLLLGFVGLMTASKNRAGNGTSIAGLLSNGLAIVVALVMTYVIFAYFTASDPDALKVERGPAISVTVMELDTEIEADPAKAEAKYVGQVVEVTGRVVSIKHEYPTTIVVLADGSSGFTFRYHIPTQNSNPSNAYAEMGRAVTIRGLCGKGYGFSHCLIVGGPEAAAARLPAPMPVLVQAQTLGAEYQADPKKADANYRGRLLEITGRIEYLEDRGDWGKSHVSLAGVPNSVVCNFPVYAVKSIGNLKVGDTITIRGTCVGTRSTSVELHASSVIEFE